MKENQYLFRRELKNRWHRARKSTEDRWKVYGESYSLAKYTQMEVRRCIFGLTYPEATLVIDFFNRNGCYATFGINHISVQGRMGDLLRLANQIGVIISSY